MYLLANLNYANKWFSNCISCSIIQINSFLTKRENILSQRAEEQCVLACEFT